MFLPVMKRKKQIREQGKSQYLGIIFPGLPHTTIKPNKPILYYQCSFTTSPFHKDFISDYYMDFFIFMMIEFCKVSGYLSILLRLKAITVVKVLFY